MGNESEQDVSKLVDVSEWYGTEFVTKDSVYYIDQEGNLSKEGSEFVTSAFGRGVRGFMVESICAGNQDLVEKIYDLMPDFSIVTGRAGMTSEGHAFRKAMSTSDPEEWSKLAEQTHLPILRDTKSLMDEHGSEPYIGLRLIVAPSEDYLLQTPRTIPFFYTSSLKEINK